VAAKQNIMFSLLTPQDSCKNIIKNKEKNSNFIFPNKNLKMLKIGKHCKF